MPVTGASSGHRPGLPAGLQTGHQGHHGLPLRLQAGPGPEPAERGPGPYPVPGILRRVPPLFGLRP